MSLGMSYARNQLFMKLGLVAVLVSLLAWALIKNISAMLDDAYQAQVRATVMSLKRSVLSAREQWFIQGQPVSAQPLKGFGRGDLIMSSAGWPVDAVRDGDNAAEDITAMLDAHVRSSLRCQRLWHALLELADQPALVWTQSEPLARASDGKCIYLFVAPVSGRETAQIEYSPHDGHINYFIR